MKLHYIDIGYKPKRKGQKRPWPSLIKEAIGSHATTLIILLSFFLIIRFSMPIYQMNLIELESVDMDGSRPHTDSKAAPRSGGKRRVVALLPSNT